MFSGGASAPTAAPSLVAFEGIGPAPSWGAIEATIAGTETGRALALALKEREAGAGPAHTDAALRLFGTDQEPRVTLYRDRAGWCPYCQKVWLLLEEKQIPYRVEKVAMRSYGDKPQSFLNKVPSGLLPAIELDGKLYTESLVIMQLLEQTFPEVATVPSEAQGLARAKRLLELERQLFSWWCSLTFRPGNQAKSGFESCLDEVERALGEESGHPWLLVTPRGQGPSLVDLQYISHVERMAASALYWKGLDLRNTKRWPLLELWFRAFEERPAYLATKSDYYTHCQDIPPQYGPGYGSPAGASFSAAIDGQGPSGWRLPLPELDATSTPEPFYLTGGQPVDQEAARHEAAAKLAGNREKVLMFALRGAGTKGAKRFQAPLADPYATPSEDPSVAAATDLLLRSAVALLAEGDATGEGLTAEGLRAGLAEVDGAAAAEAKVCGAYLRDRIGVPRDMSFPAARQLRAHLNWAIDALP